MNNKLTAIRTFLLVTETGSFSAAARQTGMKQSAVSQQIASLEDELGVVLLHRTTRAMALTAQGEHYRREMQPLLAAMEEVENQLKPEEQQWQGKVHLQLPSGVGQLFLAPLLALQKATPGLNLTLSLDDRMADLVSEGVDVALRLSGKAPEIHAAKMLTRIETALVASPDFAHVTSLNELLLQPHIRFSRLAQDQPLTLISTQESIAVNVNTVMRANTSEALLQALLAGIGIGGMQLPLAVKALQSGALIRVLPEYRLPDRYLYAVFPDARFIPVRVRRIVALLEDLAKNLPVITNTGV